MPAEKTCDLTMQQLPQVLAVLPVAVATFDASGRVTSATGGGYPLMGLRADDTVGVSLLSQSGRSPLAHAVRAALDGTSTSFALDFDGRWWQCHVSPHPEGSGGCLVGTEAAESGRLEQVLASMAVPA